MEEPKQTYDDVWKKPDQIVKKTGLKVLVWGAPERSADYLFL